MATLYGQYGDVVENIQPKDGVKFSLEELQEFVGGLVEFVYLKPGDGALVINEEGKFIYGRNAKATALCANGILFPGDFIAGPALHMSSEELAAGEDDDDDDEDWGDDPDDEDRSLDSDPYDVDTDDHPYGSWEDDIYEGEVRY